MVDLNRIGLASPQGKSCGVVVGDTITESLKTRRRLCGLLWRVLLLLLRWMQLRLELMLLLLLLLLLRLVQMLPFPQ